MDVSIIIPVLNEKKNVLLLARGIKKQMMGMDFSYEVLFIDDGSTDGTFYEIKRIEKENKEFRSFGFLRNLGKSEALSAGFSIAKGSLIITMDGDLEDDPCEIPRMLKAIKGNYDMVVGWRHKRKHGIMKRLFSKVYNTMIFLTVGLNIHDSNCGFKIMKRSVIDSVQLYGDMHRYLPAISKLAGFKVGEIKVGHCNRRFGRSKYGNLRILRGMLDLVTINFLYKYSFRPLHFFGTAGIAFSSLGALIVAAMYIRKYAFGIPINTYPFLFIIGVFLILAGIQFFSIGLIGEMITKNSSRPRYIFR